MCFNYGYCGFKELNILNYIYSNCKLNNRAKLSHTENSFIALFMFVILTAYQIQYRGFITASVKKIGDMIRDPVRILYLLFLWTSVIKIGCSKVSTTKHFTGEEYNSDH